MNVLIVDDDLPMANLIAATLRSLAPHIEIAGSFQEAKEWIRKLQFQVILLDLKLPDSHVDYTLARLKELKEFGSKVVIITGAWPPNAPLNHIEAGAEDVIYKGDLDMKERLKACVQEK